MTIFRVINFIEYDFTMCERVLLLSIDRLLLLLLLPKLLLLLILY